MILWLRDAFEGDDYGRGQLAQYAEPQAGNKAIHFAVVNGNEIVLDILINEFKCNPWAITGKGLTVIHCAA